MAKGHKPKAGSRAFWPRVRAKRIYPGFKMSDDTAKVSSTYKETKPLEFAGYKAGMTHVAFTDHKKDSATAGQEIDRAVTVLDCPPLHVVGLKIYIKKDDIVQSAGMIWSKEFKKEISRKMKVPKKPEDNYAYWKKKIGEVHDVRLLVQTQPRSSGLSKKKPEVFEMDIGGIDVMQKLDYGKEKLGKEINISEVFNEGEYLDVKAVSTGKGFQGVVKRFGVTIRSRKNKLKRRHIGTMGPVTPARVLPGKIPQAGQLGFQNRTEFNKRVMKIGEDGLAPKGGFVKYGSVPKTYLLIEGSIPGPKKRLVMFRKSFRMTDKKSPADISHVSLESQQR